MFHAIPCFLLLYNAKWDILVGAQAGVPLVRCHPENWLRPWWVAWCDEEAGSGTRSLLSPGEMCDVAEQHSTSGTVAIRARDRTAILGRNALRCDMRLQPLTLLKETCCHNTV